MPPKRARAGKKEQAALDKYKERDADKEVPMAPKSKKKSEAQSLQELAAAMESVEIAPEPPQSPPIPASSVLPTPENQESEGTPSYALETPNSHNPLQLLPLVSLPSTSDSELDRRIQTALPDKGIGFEHSWGSSNSPDFGEEAVNFRAMNMGTGNSPAEFATPQAILEPLPSTPLPEPPISLKPVMPMDRPRSPSPVAPIHLPRPSPRPPPPPPSIPTFPSYFPVPQMKRTAPSIPSPPTTASGPPTTRPSQKTKKRNPPPSPLLATQSTITPPHAEAIDGSNEFMGVEWFKDPPPRSAPLPSVTSVAAPVQIPTMPSNEVLAKNEMLIFALKACPSVLFDRFQQFGQLGVLGWCSEFSELVDDIKSMGLEGNMFTTTRDHALTACREILQVLRVQIQVNMQLIILYMSSQVARLRRFLDGDRDFDDYPIPDFPLPTD